MEACQAVAREQDKVISKLEELSSSSRERLELAINKLTMLRASLHAQDGSKPVSDEQRQQLRECEAAVKSCTALLSQEHKDSHAPISKFGRSIDKYFIQDITGVSVSEVFAGDNNKLLNKALCEHLLREGRMDVADTLINEMGLSRNENFVSMFTDIHHIAQSLRDHCVEPALDWVAANKQQLEANNSSLEFKLLRHKFLSLISSGQSIEAVKYSKNLGHFFPSVKREIQRLMGCLLFAHTGLESSPYADLLNPWHWTDLVDTFTRDACRLLGLSLESPLAVSLSIGCSALPQLLHLQSVMALRQVSDVLSQHNELPCEIQLSWEHRFHSIFTCPILRQQTSDQNPPVRLACGHAISHDAMKRLVNTHSARLKCPYCPVEMYSKDVLQLKF